MSRHPDALRMLVTSADVQDRALVYDLCTQLQEVTQGATDVVLADPESKPKLMPRGPTLSWW